jgi:hypothetical protein
MPDPVNTPAPAQPFAEWLIEALGFNAIFLPLLGLLLVSGGLVAVIRSRNAGTLLGWLALVPWPLMLGMIGFFHGVIDSFSVSTTDAPALKDFAWGIPGALANPLCALACTLPGYVVISTGLLLRTIKDSNANDDAGSCADLRR